MTKRTTKLHGTISVSLLIKHHPHHWLSSRRGSLLLEAILAIGIFAIFLGGIGSSLILGERSTLASGDRSRGAFIASAQLEGLREMRHRNFELLTNGTHGMILTETGWNFSGTSILRDGYRSSVTITTHEEDWADIASTVSWNFQNTRSGSITMNTSITNWEKNIPIGNWATIRNSAKISVSDTADLQKITGNDQYIFITGTKIEDGAGLYVYDKTDPASPVRVASNFDLSASAYDIAVRGNRLFIITDDPAQELQVYDITSPETFTTSNLLRSLDLPGAGRARSIAIYGTTIFVGMLDTPPNPQLYSIQMSETGPMTVLDSLSVSGSILGISLHEGYAYIASSSNAGELQVVDIFNPKALTFAPNTGIDLPDTQDGNAIATFGTAAILGRLNGSTIDELSSYLLENSPVPITPPGPWSLEIGGDINAIAILPGSKYAFLGTSADAAQVQVLDTTRLLRGQSPVLASYDAEASIRGLWYSWQDAKLYAISDASLYVFSPQ